MSKHEEFIKLVEDGELSHQDIIDLYLENQKMINVIKGMEKGTQKTTSDLEIYINTMKKSKAKAILTFSDKEFIDCIKFSIKTAEETLKIIRGGK